MTHRPLLLSCLPALLADAALPALLGGALLAGAALPVAAQQLESVAVNPARAAVGQPVEIVVKFDTSSGLNCNVRAHFGDGRTQDFRVNQYKDARYTLSHRYDKPGDYTVRIEPRTDLPVLRCLGQPQQAALSITATADPAPAAPVKR